MTQLLVDTVAFFLVLLGGLHSIDRVENRAANNEHIRPAPVDRLPRSDVLLTELIARIAQMHA